MRKKNKEKPKTSRPKTTIDELDLFDVPMVGVFKNKDYAAYTLRTLAGIDVKNLDDMSVRVEDFLENTKKGKRNMRMDARIDIKGQSRSNIEIQRLRKGDELQRVLNYTGGLLTDYPRGLKSIPKTGNIVIFICNFDPFENTPYEGQTRMRYTLKSDDDEEKFNTLTGKPYPFDGLTIILYNGKQDWDKNPPKSEEEERIRVYLEDMKKADPNDMVSEIAKKASKEYKEDPVIMSKTEDWIRYNFADQFDEQAKMYEKRIRKAEQEKERIKEESKRREIELKNEAEAKEKELKEENEKQLLNQRIQLIENLISSNKMTLAEISKITGLDEKEVEEISLRKE